jgi:cytochrome c
VCWLVDPPAMKADTAMPAVGLGERDARDIAAYLYTLE